MDRRMRDAVRALVVDPDRNVLLVHFDWPGLDVPGGFWACPGGGLEPGEDRHAALRRELLEEVGLRDPCIGPAVWRKSHVFDMSGWDGQNDTYYLVEVDHFEPVPQLTPAELRRENVHGLRWFSPEEVARADVVFSPRGLSAHLVELWRHGPPTTPRQIPAL
jgi:8-oxo-dGTP diphosphatase